MIFNMTGGGTGEGLNLKIIGSTTLPTNPKENTIWVNTDTEISSWIFAFDEPTEPEENMVWFETTISSDIELNALKKNGIQVYPLYAKQYVGNTWVDVEFEVYQNKKWNGLGEYLFHYGQQTYTWIASNLVSHITVNNDGVTPGITTNDDGSVTITMDDGGVPENQNTFGSGIYRVYDAINFTNFKTITIDVETSGYTTAYWVITIFPTNADAWGWDSSYNGDSVAYLEIPSYGSHTLTFDVSSISGTYYIGIGAQCSDYYDSYCKLNSIYMR